MKKWHNSLSELLTAGLGAHLKFPSSGRAFEQAELPAGSSGSSPTHLSKAPRGTLVSDTKQINTRYFFFKQ